MPARFLRPTAPGGLMSPAAVVELTSDEELVIQTIAAGGYFFENEVPSGTVNGSNTTFTLANTPNPATSLELKVNGVYQKAGGEDYTLTDDTIEFVVAPPTSSILLASYRVSPV